MVKQGDGRTRKIKIADWGGLRGSTRI